MACWQIANGESGPVPADTSELSDPPSGMAAATNSEPPNGEEPKPKNKGGRPTKATDELMAAIFDDLSLGMTEEQACAGHDVRADTFSKWKNLPEFAWMRAKAQYCQIKRLIHKQETEPEDWKRWQWRLQCTYRAQFGEPNKIGVQINQQFNDGNLGISQTDLEDARKRLDETKRLQQNRKAGVATNAELRETMIRQIEECQHVVDCIDRGEIPSQEDQQKLYRLHEEGGDRDEEPIREAIGHVVDGKPLALEDQGGLKPAPEQELESRPKRPAPQDHSMRASDMDLSSGQRKRRSDNSGDSQESQAPPEPHVRQQDRKPPVGPLSERQRQRLEQEKARRGGEGKNPFG